MLSSTKKLLRDNAYAIAIFATFTIAFLSLAKLNGKVPSFNFSYDDKLKHSFAYFLLTLIWFFATDDIGAKKQKIRYILFVVICLYGLLMEFLQQTFTDYRQADFFDALANVMGVLIGFFSYDVLFKFLR
ncbi:MAG: VanZ family protein, partial [Flavicella sp.]